MSRETTDTGTSGFENTSASTDPSSIVQGANYTLVTEPSSSGELRVVSLSGTEALSKPFRFDVVVLAPRELDLLAVSMLGRRAVLTMHADQSPRTVRGIITAVRPMGTSERTGLSVHRLRLEPRLTLLRARTGSRIFQHLRAPETIARILEAAGIAATWQISRSYAKREYCVQYQESDFGFVKRLLAEEGIFYYFDHDAETGDGSIMADAMVVFADDVQAYPPIRGPIHDAAGATSPTLHLREGRGRSSTDDDVREFALERSARTGAVLLRDYDFRRPLLDLRSEAAVPEDANGGVGEASLRSYRHRGDYELPDVTPLGAQVELEQHRRRALVGEGASHCRRLEPGRRFQLQADAGAHLSGEYVVTRVSHEGHAPEWTDLNAGEGDSPRSYANQFACVPANAPYRPKPPRRALRQVLESAVVVGPEHEEIYTDAYGRIKVQFHCSTRSAARLRYRHDRPPAGWLAPGLSQRDAARRARLA